MKLPKELRDQSTRKEFERAFFDAIDAGEIQKDGLLERVERNEAFYQNRIVSLGKLPWPGAKEFHIPIVKPRLGQRKANVVQTVTANKPMFTFTELGTSEKSDPISRCVQFFLDVAGFETALDRAVQLAMTSVLAVWRVTFQELPVVNPASTYMGPYAGPVFDVIHVANFVVYPASEGGIDQARMHGHYFEQTAAQVAERMSAGEFLAEVDAKSLAGDQPLRERENMLQSTEGMGDPEDDLVKCIDALFRFDPGNGKPSRMYRVIGAPTSRTLLFVERYKLPLSWYVPMSLEWEHDCFYPEGGPAQDVQGMQILMNTLVNEFVWGTQMRSRPAVLTEGWSLGKAVEPIQPGKVINRPKLGRSMPVPAGFDPTGFDFLIGLIRQMADSATNVSDAMSASPSVGSERTATEQEIKYRGFQLAGSDDVMAITPALRRLVLTMMMLLKSHYARWRPLYGERLEIAEEDLGLPFVVEISGRAMEDSPAAQQEQSKTLLEVAKAFPDSGIPVLELVKTIVLATSLANKDEIVAAIEQQEQAMGGMGTVETPEQLAAIVQQLQAQYGQGGMADVGDPGAGAVAAVLEQLAMAGGGANAFQAPV